MATKKTTPSTALSTQKKANTNLVDIKAQLAAQVAALAERTAPATGSAVRITQDKKFKFPDGTEDTKFSAVIVDFTTTRKFYPGAFDPNNITPPACFAISQQPKGMIPSVNSPEKQAESCDTCPNNQWGSAGAGKACKEGRKLAILPPLEEGEDPAQLPIWTMEISPTGIKPFDGFVSSTAKMFGVPPVGVIADVGFDQGQTYASVRMSNPEPNPALGEYLARQAEAQDILAVEPDVSGYGQEAPAPTRGRAPAAKRPAARR